MSTELKVGQKLWYVPNSRRENPQEVTIKKVGRKWVELEETWFRRLDKETLRMDAGNYMSPGRCHLSREKYEAEHARQLLFFRFKNLVSSLQPGDLTTDRIQRAAEALDINLGEKQ